ncbi:MAG: PilZ domain-containing protein [Alphaproteobacteria bacterium]|nr:PilZ domain-containing protein [Alphaproteobacteria bacterium]MBV9371953.1 PilZ domain-containing protein [Alphaproteobacteria bacterium]MBV9900402.1 PilZ domain-containing protein [Alphaproteobacteria bacterium]
MALSAELSTQPDGEGRRAERREVVLGAGLRQRGAHAVTVQVVDLSVSGFRAATHLDLLPGSDVWLKLPGLESLHARVVWMRGHLMGCEFVRPLHPAVLDMVARAVR